MTFIDYIKNNHPDPDTLLGKPVWEGMDELLAMHRKYLIENIWTTMMEPQNMGAFDFNYGVNTAIRKIKQS